MEIKCKECGKEKKYMSSERGVLFCSKVCNRMYNKKITIERNTIICKVCNNTHISQGGYKNGRKYCSLKCKSIDSKVPIKEQICKGCKSIFYKKTLTKFCNKSCSFKHREIRIEPTIYKRKKSSSWIRKVKERDGYKCKVCNDSNNLEVHHIVPYRSYPEIYDLDMNGVTLCKKCHLKYDELNRIEYGTTGRYTKKINNPNSCFMATIPHELHRYPTCGDYEWTRNGTLIIFISNMNNKKYEYLIFLHEYIESNLCKFRGIKEKDITTFDIFYEMKRSMNMVDEFSEPGDSDMAPYKKEHQLSTSIEMMLAKELKINWEAYSDAVNKL